MLAFLVSAQVMVESDFLSLLKTDRVVRLFLIQSKLFLVLRDNCLTDYEHEKHPIYCPRSEITSTATPNPA